MYFTILTVLTRTWEVFHYQDNVLPVHDSHYKDKTVVRPSYPFNLNPHLERQPLCWNGASNLKNDFSHNAFPDRDRNEYHQRPQNCPRTVSTEAVHQKAFCKETDTMVTRWSLSAAMVLTSWSLWIIPPTVKKSCFFLKKSVPVFHFCWHFHLEPEINIC